MKKLLYTLALFVCFSSFGQNVDNNKNLSLKYKELKGLKQQQKKDTTIISFYDNGAIKSEEVYINGVLDGESKYFFQNGSIKEIHYNWKKWTLFIKTFYLNGQLKSEGELKDNFKDGEWIYYNNDGTINMKKIYSYSEEYDKHMRRLDGL